MSSILVRKGTIILTLLLILVAATRTFVSAQVVNQWAPPRPIPDYEGSRPPIMIADQNKTVHIFYSYPLEGLIDAIYYRQWSLDQGWTQPVDILMVARTVPNHLQSVFLDQSGVFHLIFFGDDPDSGNIYYSQALATEAGRAQSWMKPVVIGPNAGPVVSAEITGDGKGNLIVLYSGQGQGIGLYEVRSADSGNTWTDPIAVTLLDQKDNWPYSIRFGWSPQGELQTVWSVVNGDGVGTGVYYARLSSDLLHWTSPYLLAQRDPGDYSTSWPAIFVDGEELIVVYQDGFPAAKFMRVSKDGGQTWTDAIRPFPHIGEYENPVIVKDSSGVIHMILGNRIGNPATHGMWHSVWLGDGWSDLDPVKTGPRTNIFDPSAPQAVISQGNVLLVAWRDDVAEAVPAEYTYEVLNTPELPVVPLPAPTAMPTSAPLVTQITETSTPTPALPGLMNTQNSGINASNIENPSRPVMIALIPVILFVAGFIVFRLWYQSNRQP